jgi:hypothetical protein
MTEPTPASPSPAPPSPVGDSLHAIAVFLRSGQPLSPEAQTTLADLLDELGTIAAEPAPPPAEVAHLAESMSHLVAAAAQGRDRNVWAAARTRLERAAAGVEAQAPTLAGLARRLLDALSNIGI